MKIADGIELKVYYYKVTEDSLPESLMEDYGYTGGYIELEVIEHRFDGINLHVKVRSPELDTGRDDVFDASLTFEGKDEMGDYGPPISVSRNPNDNSIAIQFNMSLAEDRLRRSGLI